MIQGRWYWVTNDRSTWWPALADANSAGGWTNSDTWEDFDQKVVSWVLIPLPNEVTS